MWFEILPAAGVMFGAMTLGRLGACAVPLLMFGNGWYRDLNQGLLIYFYHRDEDIDGNRIIGAYRPKGLECIADEPPKKE